MTATCFYSVSPPANFVATTDSSGNYSISALGEVSGSNCIVKVSPCPLRLQLVALPEASTQP